MASTNARDYLVGSTVRLQVATRDPDTRAPVDPPAPPNLVHLGSPSGPMPLPTVAAFTRVTPGEYQLSLQTVGFLPGVYTWRAEAMDETGDVALSEDTFVLRTPA